MMLLRGILAWGVLISIFAGLFLLFTQTERDEIGQSSETLQQRMALLARLENLPKRESQIREALNQLNDGLEQRSLYSGNASTVRTEVQRDVREIAKTAKIRLGSMRPLGARPSDDELAVSAIQLNYTTTHQANLSFLKLIEEAEPVLRVQRMSISVRTASTETEAAQIAVTMEVAGHLLQGQLGR